MKQFNIRVYGIIENEIGEILISSERRNRHEFTKFPGGGMEFGEGTRDCLKRELKEELNADAVIGELFYLTDFYQASAFHPDHQIISVYYFAQISDWKQIHTSMLEPGTENLETFRWIAKSELKEQLLTFPIDQIVCKKLKEEFDLY